MRPAAAAEHRDGLWTEMEGVVRRVNADGTLLLMGKNEPIPLWLGQTERSRLDEFVDSAPRSWAPPAK